MRFLLLASCFAFVMSFMMAAPVQAKGRNGRGRTLFGGSQRADSDEDARAEDAQSPTPAQAPASEASENNQPTALHSVLKRPSKHQQLLIAEQTRDQKLAEAEHLREIALKSGNPGLLANANRMEEQALQQYNDRAAQLGRFGVTDPALAQTTVPPIVLPPPPMDPVPRQPLPARRPVDVIIDTFNFLRP